MTRCCVCDYDPLAPTAFSTSVMSGSKAGAVRYRKKFDKDLCPGCYSAILATVITDSHRESMDDSTLVDLEDALDLDCILRNTSSVSLREFE